MWGVRKKGGNDTSKVSGPGSENKIAVYQEVEDG